MEENKINEDIKRIKSIMSYGTLNEDEMDDMEMDEPTNDATDEFGDEAGLEEPTADNDLDSEFDELEEPDAEDGELDTPEDDVEEIDITDLVNKVSSISDLLTNMGKSIETVDTRFNALEQNHDVTTEYLNRISNYIETQLGDVNQKLDLMRPPTQQEREKALAQNSYPFNTKVDEYKPQNKLTQTDLEREKLSVKDLLDDMDVNAVKQSFSMKDDTDTQVARRFNTPSYRY